MNSVHCNEYSKRIIRYKHGRIKYKNDERYDIIGQIISKKVKILKTVFYFECRIVLRL